MTDNQTPNEPGFLGVLQNQAIGVPAFTPRYDIGTGAAEEKDDNALTLVFSGEVRKEMSRIAAELGFDNLVTFINTATSVYGQMMGAAKNEGFRQVLLVNPDTEKVINVPLIPDGV